jgi:uncharacterized protein involved in outer membrane biogenesis
MASEILIDKLLIKGTMALQNLQQYGCQTGNKLKEKLRDLNQIKMTQCSVADTKTVRSLEF